MTRPRCIHCPNIVAVRGTRCTHCRQRRRDYKGPRVIPSLRLYDVIHKEAKTLAKLADTPLTEWIADAVVLRIEREAERT